MAEARAYLYRERDGAIVEVAIPEAVIDRPAILPSHRMQSGTSTTTMRQRLPLSVRCTVTISVLEVGASMAEQVRAQLVDSDELWRLYTPGQAGIRDLMIGSTTERRGVYDAVDVDMELQEVAFFDLRTEAVQPRSDYAGAAVGTSGAEEDRGSVALEEPTAAQGGIVANLLGIGQP